jgi:transcription elongation factor Elf1
MPLTDRELETIEYKLKKRGFKQGDVYHHECPTCNEKAVRIFTILAKTGGRDIRLCLACGKATSFRASAGMEGREEDANFDLETFLR